MRNLFRKMKELQTNNLYYLCFCVQIISIILYGILIKGLERPGGLIEIVKFLFFNPGDYLIALIGGGWAWFMFVVLLISNVMQIPIMEDILDYDDCYYYGNYGDFQDVGKKKMILNIILCVVGLTLNMYFLSDLLAITAVFAILMVLIFIMTQ